MLKTKNIFFLTLVLAVIALAGFNSCGVYSFADVSIPDSIKTVRINFFENRAQYINPRLAQALTERVRQRIINQTKLTQTNSDNAHYDISAVITNYSVSTSGISTNNDANRREASMNNLNVGLTVTLRNQLSGGEPQEFQVSRSFPFSATLSLQSAESRLLDEIVTNLTDDIFNRLFSNW
jgi:hypothetical protein